MWYMVCDQCGKRCEIPMHSKSDSWFHLSLPYESFSGAREVDFCSSECLYDYVQNEIYGKHVAQLMKEA